MAFHDWLELLALMTPFLALAFAILYVGYTAYDARLARERGEHDADFDPAVPVEDIARINSLIAVEARQARETLAQARETLSRGIKG